MRKEILFALALVTCPGLTAASAQDNASPPAAAAATPDASSAPGEIIHLHMPVHHHRAARAHTSAKPAETAAPAETPTVDSIGADSAALPPAAPPVSTSAEASSPPPAAKPAKASRARAQKPTPTIPFSFGEDSGMTPPGSSPPAGNPAPQAAASIRQTRTASLPSRREIPKPTPAAPKFSKEAAGEAHTGLAKRGAVLFDKGKSNPSPQQFDGLKLLAGELSTALESGRGPVQLEAYAGGRGDTSSDAHRLSLKRAIAVRQLLIDDGLPSSRIVVRAMGGAADNGPTDRVDVFVRAS